MTKQSGAKDICLEVGLCVCVCKFAPQNLIWKNPNVLQIDKTLGVTDLIITASNRYLIMLYSRLNGPSIVGWHFIIVFTGELIMQHCKCHFTKSWKYLGYFAPKIKIVLKNVQFFLQKVVSHNVNRF